MLILYYRLIRYFIDTHNTTDTYILYVATAVVFNTHICLVVILVCLFSRYLEFELEEFYSFTFHDYNFHHLTLNKTI